MSNNDNNFEFKEYQTASQSFYTQTIDSLKKQRNFALGFGVACLVILLMWGAFVLRVAPVNNPLPIIFKTDDAGNINVDYAIRERTVDFSEIQKKADAIAYFKALFTYDRVDWDYRQEFLNLRSTPEIEKQIKAFLELRKKEVKDGMRKFIPTSVLFLNANTLQVHFFIEPPYNTKPKLREYYVGVVKFNYKTQVRALRSYFINPNGFEVNELRFDRDYSNNYSDILKPNN